MIKKNELLDSLDLNVGMDALMKLQDVWGKNPRKNSKKLEPLTAAPVPINAIALNKIDMVKIETDHLQTNKRGLHQRRIRKIAAKG